MPKKQKGGMVGAYRIKKVGGINPNYSSYGRSKTPTHINITPRGSAVNPTGSYESLVMPIGGRGRYAKKQKPMKGGFLWLIPFAKGIMGQQ